MDLVDTHCHLYSEQFDADRPQMMQRAKDAGVRKFYLPSIDSQSTPAMLQLESDFPNTCVAMTGLHPCSVKANYLDELRKVEQSLSRRFFVAIGEIGLDFFWDRTFEREQVFTFHRQIEWALAFNIPIVIHSRNSLQEAIAIVKEHQQGSLKGIFHCFSGSEEVAKQIVDLGFFLGIGGVITFKKAGLAETIKHIDLRNLVLETDAPYLAPVPFRGKRNESSYLTIIARKIAELKETSLFEVAGITTENAITIFGS